MLLLIFSVIFNDVRTTNKGPFISIVLVWRRRHFRSKYLNTWADKTKTICMNRHQIVALDTVKYLMKQNKRMHTYITTISEKVF